MTARLTAIIRTPEPRVLDDPFFRLVEGEREGRHRFLTPDPGTPGVDASEIVSSLRYSFICSRLCAHIWPLIAQHHDLEYWGPIFPTPITETRIQIARRGGIWLTNIAQRVNPQGQWVFFPAQEREWEGVAQVLATRYFHGPGFGLE